MFEFLLFWKRPTTPLEMAVKETEKKETTNIKRHRITG